MSVNSEREGNNDNPGAMNTPHAYILDTKCHYPLGTRSRWRNN